jgi:hypothetical protein
VRRHPQGVPGFRHQVQDREQVGTRIWPQIFGRRLHVVVDENPAGRVVVVGGVGDRRGVSSNPVLDYEARDGAPAVLPLGEVEDDGGGVDPEKVSARRRRDGRRALSSSRDRLGALAEPEIIASLFKKNKKIIFHIEF